MYTPVAITIASKLREKLWKEGIVWQSMKAKGYKIKVVGFIFYSL